MSYTTRARPQALATSSEKRARASEVLSALGQLHNWEVVTQGDFCRITVEKRHSIVLALKTGEFTYDSDFRSTLEPELRKILKADGNLSDQYEAADIGVANKQAHGWDWHWVAEDAIEIENTEVFA